MATPGKAWKNSQILAPPHSGRTLHNIAKNPTITTILQPYHQAAYFEVGTLTRNSTDLATPFVPLYTEVLDKKFLNCPGAMQHTKPSHVNFRFMLAALILIMLGGPAIREFTPWDHPELLEIVFGASIALLLASLAGDVRVFRIGLGYGLVTFISAVLAVTTGEVLFRYIVLLGMMLFCLAAIKYSARLVFLAGAVDLNKIVGSICIYLLLILTWAILYEFLELVTPGSFTGIDADNNGSRFYQFIYFSIVTITTLGYGDTTPSSLVAGFWAGMEALIGVFYMAILVASLVGDFMSRNQTRSEPP